MTNEKTARWDRHFIDMAVLCASMSKDPRTQVGAVIVGPDLEVRSTGFNGFPRGIADTFDRLNDKETKLDVIQAGIVSVVSLPFKSGVSTWASDVASAGVLLKEAGVRYRECEKRV